MKKGFDSIMNLFLTLLFIATVLMLLALFYNYFFGGSSPKLKEAIYRIFS